MESVNVVIRFRAGETGDPNDFANWQITPTSIKSFKTDKTFNFDHVLDATKSQADAYEACGRNLVNQLQYLISMDGFNGTIFAYGQSGSGKTFSMLGPQEVTEILVNQSQNIPQQTQQLFGIIPRCTFHIFEIVNAGIKQGIQYTIKCSYIEIYNEAINDILSNPANTNLKMREFPNLGMCVIGLIEKYITTPEEIFECLSIGTANRIVCATGQNARSSRSHTVFIITIDQKNPDGSTKISKLNLVDLAGSEKLSKTGATGQALIEAQNINQSLTTLGRCIKELTSKKPGHIPYRESKLTLILQESLGGNAKTTLVCTASKKKVHSEQTLTTIRFGQRAKMIKNSAKSNVKRSVEELEAIINKLKAEIVRLKKRLADRDAGEAPIEDVEADETEEAKQDESINYHQLVAQHQSMKANMQKQIQELQAALQKAESQQTSVDHLLMHEQIQAYQERIDQANSQLQTITKKQEEQRLMYEHVIDQMNSGSKELERKLDVLTQDHQQQVNKNKELNNSLTEKEREIFTFKENLEESERKIKHFQGELADSKEELKKALLENESLLSKIKNLGAELQKVLGEKKKTEEQIKNQEQNVEDLTHRVFQLEDKHETYQMSIEKLSKENHELKTHKSQLTEKLESLQLEFKEQSEQNAVSQSLMAKQVASLQEELKQASNQQQSLKELLQENENAQSMLEQRERYASEMNRNFQQTISRLQGQNQTSLQKITSLAKELQEKTQNEISLTKQKEKSAQQFKTLNEKHNKVIRQLNDEKQNRTRLAQNLKQLETKQQEDQQKLSQITKQLAQQTSALSELNQTCQSQKQTIQTQNQTISKIKQESYQQQEALRLQIKTLKTALFEKQQEIQTVKYTYQSKIDQVNLQVKELNKGLQDKSLELHKEKLRTTQIQKELSDARVEILQLKADVNQKIKQRQIERKSTIMRTGAGLAKRPSMLATKVNEMNYKPPQTGFPGITLRKTNNQFLQNAIKESQAAARLAPVTQFVVNYGLDEIKSLYADTNYITERGERSDSLSSDSEDLEEFKGP